AQLIPCTQLLPAGWSLNDVKVGTGSASIIFDTDRPHQQAAVLVRLTPSCDLTGSTEVSSEQPGARRYIRIDRAVTPAQVTRSYTFRGGCITERFLAAPGISAERLASEASSSLGFATRQELAQVLDQQSDGRLQLDPP
ncbi:MAG TPA: hypothetical protein VG409_12790, partial [Actinomycetota bacterium]|nr:hypothetical protein [Actinomycetota bacterium]